MLTLSKGVFTTPTISYQDKLMYMTSLGLYHSIGDENSNNPVLMDQIFDLVSTSSTRYIGLQLLVLAFQQNPDHVCAVGRWPETLYPVIKDCSASLEKNLACKVLSMIIPYMADDSKSDDRDEFVKDIFPFLLKKINENVEWSDEASICVKTSLKVFPRELHAFKRMLLNTILSQATSSVSSKSFEVLAECFCLLPYCIKENIQGPEYIQKVWNKTYLRTLKTIESLQHACLNRLNDCEPYEKLNIEASEFDFPPDNENDNTLFLVKFTKRVRRFVNLCKCLAKLISTQPKYPGKVYIMHTLNILMPMYRAFRREKYTGVDEETLYTFLPQMRLAGLVVVEALILNCNMFKEAKLLKDFLTMSLKCSTTISSENVSELRAATWKLVSLWLDGFGGNAAEKIAEGDLTDEIMKDIKIDKIESSQVNNVAQTHKSNKNPTSNSSRKSILKRKKLPKVCEAALNSLESFLYIGSPYISKRSFQRLCETVFKICESLPVSCDSFPFPYNDESCRERLYSVVLAIAVVAKPDEFQNLETAQSILDKINSDPSFKVKRLKSKMPAMFKLLTYPRRPLPPYSEIRQEQQNVLNTVGRSTEWLSPHLEQNLEVETKSGMIENVNVKVEQSFQNENENEIHHEEEFMEVEQHYHEQVNENQCNGEDIYEIQSSSQCQDDIESDEEDEDEDEERSYDDEEMNQDEHIQEMYIPSSRKSPLPIQINAVETVQSVSEQEYEECTPCVKNEENSVSSIKETCVNGEDNVIQDAEVPPSSAQIANENGIFGVDDDDLDEENEEEEDEEESESFQAEKKEESQDPPIKRQKIQAEDSDNVHEREDSGATSPTLDEMKADFLKVIPSSSVEEVNTEKTQMSISS